MRITETPLNTRHFRNYKTSIKEKRDKFLHYFSKRLLFCILVIFFAYGVFSSNDLIQSDRDNAVIISAKALMNFENPYSYKTEIGQVITTGLFNAFISIPFVYLFGNIQLLSFLFYMMFLIIIYKGKYFIKTAIILIISSPVLMRIMYYRLDELYWVIFYIFLLFRLKTRWKYILIIPIIFSRNIINFDFRILLYNIDYWIIIIIIYTILLHKLKKLYNPV